MSWIVKQDWYLSVFRKYAQKIQVSLKYDQNNGYITWKPTYIYDHILFSSSQYEKCFRQKLYRKSKTHILRSVIFFFENRAVYETMRKKYCIAGQTTGDIIVYAHCILEI
jgi:hypothetical protein